MNVYPKCERCDFPFLGNEYCPGMAEPKYCNHCEKAINNLESLGKYYWGQDWEMSA